MNYDRQLSAAERVRLAQLHARAEVEMPQYLKRLQEPGRAEWLPRDACDLTSRSASMMW